MVTPVSIATGITITQNIRGGRPCIAGTRIEPSAIHNFAIEGFDVDYIKTQYPDLSDRQIADALAYCAS